MQASFHQLHSAITLDSVFLSSSSSAQINPLGFTFRIWTEVSQSVLAAPTAALLKPTVSSGLDSPNSLCPLSLLPPLPPAARNPPVASCLAHNQSQVPTASLKAHVIPPNIPSPPRTPSHLSSPHHSGLLAIPRTSQTLSYLSVSALGCSLYIDCSSLTYWPGSLPYFFIVLARVSLYL